MTDVDLETRRVTRILMIDWENKIVTKQAGQAAELIVVLLVLAAIAFVIGILAGPGETPEIAEPNEPAAVSKVVYKRFRVTAYCSCERCCGQFADGITASGYKIRLGDRFVAAPSAMPFGTLLSIEGYAGGLAVPVRDRGGAITGNRLDLYFDTHKEALEWGKKYVEVRIL